MMGIVLSLLESPVISLPLQLGIGQPKLEVEIEERLAIDRKVLKVGRLASKGLHVWARESSCRVICQCCHNSNEIIANISPTSVGRRSDNKAGGRRGREDSNQQVSGSKVELNKTEERQELMSREKVLPLLNGDNDEDQDEDEDNDEYDYECNYEQSASVVNRPIRLTSEVNELLPATSGRHCSRNRVECSEKADKRIGDVGGVLNGSIGIGRSSRRASDPIQSHALCSEIALSSKDESAVNIVTQNTGKKTKQTQHQREHQQQTQQRQREQKNKDCSLSLVLNAGDKVTARARARAKAKAGAKAIPRAADAELRTLNGQQTADSQAGSNSATNNNKATNKTKTKTKLKSTNSNKISLSTTSSIHQNTSKSDQIVNLPDIDQNIPYAKHAHFGQYHNKLTTPTTNLLLEKKSHQHQQLQAEQLQQHTTSLQKSITQKPIITNNNKSISSHILAETNPGSEIMRKPPTVKKASINQRVVIEHEAFERQQVHSARFTDYHQPLLTSQHQQQRQQRYNKYQLNSNASNNHNRQYKYQTKQHPIQLQLQLQNQKHQHKLAQNHNQSLANLDDDTTSQQPTTTPISNTTQFVPNKKFKIHKQFNIINNTNNNSTLNKHLIEDGQRTRDRRSLSTTSSLASSTSSSPSSSMLQIYMRDRANTNININNNNRCTPQITTKSKSKSNNINNNNNNHHHKKHQQQQNRKNRNDFNDRKQLISSSASSTISSSSSSCDSAQLSPNLSEPEDIVSNLLLHSTANLSIHLQQAQSPPNIHPAYIQSEFNNHKTLWQFNNNKNNANNNNNNYNFHQQTNDTATNGHAQIFTFANLPPQRPWLEYKSIGQLTLAHDSTCKPFRQQIFKDVNKESEQEFTVLSYNVLCPKLVNKKKYPTSPDSALDWFYRRKLIMEQLREFDADIIALQELETEHYETYFMTELERHGNYKSIFEPKSRARTMSSEQQKRVDGCAIFYKTNKFKLVERHLLEYQLIAMANSKGSEAMLNRVMTKDNIGLVAVLELIDYDDDDDNDDEQTVTDDMIGNSDVGALFRRSVARKEQQVEAFSSMESQLNKRLKKRRQIVVCNTHIYWEPECCDVKLVQTILLMNELESIARHHGFKLRQKQQLRNELFSNNQNKLKTGGDEQQQQQKQQQQQQQQLIDDKLPLILLGDFNSLPDSGVTEFLTGGQISSLHEDFKDNKYSACSNSLTIPNVYTGGAESSTVLNYNHPFKLASAYKKDIMPFTNYTDTFKAIIDYIFYSQNSIQLLGVLGLFERNWFKENRIKGLPHVNFPSDHLPLLVNFLLSVKYRQEVTQ